jgi:hypothetical protein
MRIFDLVLKIFAGIVGAFLFGLLEYVVERVIPPERFDSLPWLAILGFGCGFYLAHYRIKRRRPMGQ